MFARYVVEQLMRQATDPRTIRAAQRAAGDALKGRSVSSADERAELPECRLLVVCATGLEADGLLSHLEGVSSTRCANWVEHAGMLEQIPLVVLETGPGAEAVGDATREALKQYKPRYVIASGFATGLESALRRGMVVIAQTVATPDAPPLKTAWEDVAEAEGGRGWKIGELLSVPEPPRSVEEKKALAGSALACDLESRTVAEAAGEQGLPFLAVRIISETLTETLPVDVETMLAQKGWAGKLGAAAGAVWNRPGSVTDLWKLKEHALKASDRLGRFLAAFLPQLVG